MKRTGVIFMLFLALSCAKQSAVVLPDSNRVSLSVCAPDSPTRRSLDTLSLTQSWEKGDEIEIRGYYKDSDSEYHYSTLTLAAEQDGSNVCFSGPMDSTLTLYPSSLLFAVSPSGKVDYVTKNNVYFVVDENQTGTLEDFGKEAICVSSTYFRAVSKSGVLTLPSVTRMRNLLPVIHFTVEEGLGIDEIEIKGFQKSEGKADAISGMINFKPSRMGFYSVTSSESKTITVSRGGAEISGHVYVCLMPDFPTRYNNDGYYTGTDAPTLDDANLRGRNCSDSLVFVFRDKTGYEVTCGSSITPKSLLSGSIKELGRVKRMPFPHYIGMEFPSDIEGFADGETFNP